MSFFASTVAGDVREQLVQVAGALCVLAARSPPRSSAC